ncbi:DNA polymerase epsilon subunit 1 [Nematocida sp. LUAm3]|nr:DNA polymerase epsilon subunit 1 [Nematocida sp. LUAm3]KAI5176141.1 DNA polymerase epsilon subunit 1 [Nematocida sp. LUAm2]KAI5179029.1 DNA polymerase epsilon subunit 1 [Nematocida sp. LUAm1]
MSAQNVMRGIGELPEYFGYEVHAGYEKKEGWLLNYHVKERECQEEGRIITYGVFYFIGEDNKNFRVDLPFFPKFLVCVQEDKCVAVEEYLMQKYQGTIKAIEPIKKTNLDEINHLKLKETDKEEKIYLSINCYTEDICSEIRRDLEEVIKREKRRREEESAVLLFSKEKKQRREESPEAYILGVHEYDFPLTVQIGIFLGINAGKWYVVGGSEECIIRESERIVPPEIKILSYDIETTKDPFKFPNSERDQVMMVSIMTTEGGWLLVNREVVQEDIEAFSFWPTGDIGGDFEIFNEKEEEKVLRRFLEVVHTYKPHVISTYNGDFFDWPFMEKRMEKYGISMRDSLGFFKNQQEAYLCEFILHLDCFKWVKRDSYLPAGSHGLKSVTRAKLGYFPDEIDPEDMLLFASTKPRVLASYSVSDAIATHFLYLKYVHPFIFSLASLIPLPPDDVLRKGTGTLCEALLMKEAYVCHVLIPPKKRTNTLYRYNGQMAESLSYVGGHVECLRSGVYRSDFEYEFLFDEKKINGMINGIDELLDIELQGKICKNKEDIKNDIKEKLLLLIQSKKNFRKPYIYHLDVGAMYPNIILTNRLQPSAVISEKTCSQCVHSKEKEKCQRKMPWKMRAELYPVDEKTVKTIEKSLIQEKNPEKLSFEVRMKEKLIMHAKRFSKRTKEILIEEKDSLICQRENPFYVNAVRTFRDRRNEYKKLAKKTLIEAQSSIKQEHSKSYSSDLFKKASIYDSLQIAHKCVLNSFYGYVMKKGARWYSMEMAAVVCQTGSHIIQRTKSLIDAFGVTLELDTDGIWAMLPEGFPLNYTMETEHGNISFSYVCSLLNCMLLKEFTNHQYMQEERGEYSTTSENSIRFELDGPYRAMFLPGSAKEGESIKKRYIVINMKEKISEIKGFEFKRRGELKFVKAFQEDFFNSLLCGVSLEQCYDSLSKCAEYWMKMIEKKGGPLSDAEIFEYFGETRSMSKEAHEYASVKSTCLTAAQRLSELLGQTVVTRGISCSFIISKFPEGLPVTSRAIPQSVFLIERELQEKYLKKWMQANVLPKDIKDIIDWDYYMERLTNVIMKIIIVPSAFQKVKNPLPKISPPSWTAEKGKLLGFLEKKIKEELPEKENTSISEKKKKSVSVPILGNSRVTDFCFSSRGKAPEEEKEQKKKKKNPSLLIKEITEHAYTSVTLKNNQFIEEIIRLKKIFYIQADQKYLDKIISTHHTKDVEVEKVSFYVLGSEKKKNLLKFSVDSEEFQKKSSRYINLFESPEIDKIIELDTPPLAKILEDNSYQELPLIVISLIKAQENMLCAVSINKEDPPLILKSKSELKKLLIKSKPSLVAISKHTGSLIDILPKEKFLSIIIDTPVQKTLKGYITEQSLLTEAAEKIRNKISTQISLSEFADIPLTNTNISPFFLLDYLFYVERRKVNILGWSNNSSLSDMHYSHSSPFTPFKKEFHLEGVYEGLSASLHLTGTVPLSIIESEQLLKEETSSIRQTREMEVLRTLTKHLIYMHIKSSSSASLLISHLSKWCLYPANNSTITDSLSQELSVYQTKFISGIIRAINLLGCKTIRTEHEDLLIFTEHASLESGKLQIHSLIKNISELEYGSLLQVEIINWYKRIILIDQINYHFLTENGKSQFSLSQNIPHHILDDILATGILSLEHLKSLKKDKEQEEFLSIGRLFSKIHSLKFGESPYIEKVANIIGTSRFSYSFTKEYGNHISFSLICPCMQATSFYAPVHKKTEEQIEEYFTYLIRHHHKKEMTCKRCKNPFKEQEIEQTLKERIRQEAKDAIKSEKKCHHCKRPSPTALSIRCPCGGRFLKNHQNIFSSAIQNILSLSSIYPTISLLIYARNSITYFTKMRLSP